MTMPPRVGARPRKSPLQIVLHFSCTSTPTYKPLARQHQEPVVGSQLVVATKTLRQSVVVNATPKQIFDALADSRRHARLIGSTAKIVRRPGGTFSMWEGSIHGTTLELVPGKKIVQAWRCQMAGWPKDHFSRLTYTFEKTGSGTRVNLYQSALPTAAFASIKQGWHDHYWTPLKEKFGDG